MVCSTSVTRSLVLVSSAEKVAFAGFAAAGFFSADTVDAGAGFSATGAVDAGAGFSATGAVDAGAGFSMAAFGIGGRVPSGTGAEVTGCETRRDVRAGAGEAS
jgi:hypothetical protein